MPAKKQVKKAAKKKQRSQPTKTTKQRRGPSQVKAAPIAFARPTQVVASGSKSVKFHRKEFLQVIHSGSIMAGDLAVAATYNLNPGLLTTFPWLATVAAYEQYRFSSVKFHFESSTSTSERGQLVMVTNVDAKDQLMTTASQLLNYKGACVGRVWDSHTHNVPLSNSVNKYYVRQGTPPPNADLSLYDVGLTYIVTLGVQPNIYIGTLWIEYDIEFFTPKQVLTDRFLRIAGDYKTVSYNEPLGDEKKWAVDSNLSWHCPDDDPEYCTFVIQPSGTDQYMLNLSTRPTKDGSDNFHAPKALLVQNADIKTESRSGAEGINSGQLSDHVGSLTAIMKVVDTALPLIFKIGMRDETIGGIASIIPELLLTALL